MRTRNIWRFFTREGLRELAAEALRGWVAPVLSAIAVSAFTMLSAFITPIPLPYLIAASAFAFGSAAWGALQVSVLRERSRVADRLSFAGVFFSRDFDQSEDGAITLKSAQFGIQMQNSAPFPIRFRVLEIRSTFEGRVYINPSYMTKEGNIMSNQIANFRDCPIQLTEGIKSKPGQRLKGTLYFKIEYDSEERFRYMLERELHIDVISDRNNPAQFEVIWGYTGRGG